MALTRRQKSKVTVNSGLSCMVPDGDNVSLLTVDR
jgi:hypothetical protein